MIECSSHYQMRILKDTETPALRLPPGVKDFLFDEAQHRRAVERAITDTLTTKGYREIITPTIEYSEVFAQASKAGAGRNGLDEKVYRFLDRDGNLLALRVDFTAQIARIAASRFAGMPAPIRVYYSGKVFRAEPHHAGRSREKWQVGFEILGSNDIEADAEAVIAILDSLVAVGIGNARVAIGHIGYFNGLIAEANCAGEELQRLKYLVERKDVTGLAQAAKDWSLPASVRSALARIPNLHGGHEILPEARQLARNDVSAQAISRLEALMKKVQKHPQSGKVFLDLSEVEGMGYYTGIMLRAFAAGVGQEIGSGGRYDELVSRFGADMPAVGFSFDIDLLVAAIRNGAL
jgi:ATP phosphoribosyltransferase regulatory subunit